MLVHVLAAMPAKGVSHKAVAACLSVRALRWPLRVWPEDDPERQCAAPSAPFGLPPDLEVLPGARIGRRIKPHDRAAFERLLGDGILERRHLDCLIGDLVGEMRRDD